MGGRRPVARRPTGPTVVASGPPITIPGGHCASMGGEATGPDALRAAVRERVGARRRCREDHGQRRGHDAGHRRPRRASSPSRRCAPSWRRPTPRAPRDGARPRAPRGGTRGRAGVDGIEHCSCLTPDGCPPAAGLWPTGWSRPASYVCPTLGRVPGVDPPPQVQARLAAIGVDVRGATSRTSRSCARAGVRLLAGTDAGIGPGKRARAGAHGVADLVAVRGARPTPWRRRPAWPPGRAVCGTAPGGWRPAWTPTCCWSTATR